MNLRIYFNEELKNRVWVPSRVRKCGEHDAMQLNFSAEHANNTKLLVYMHLLQRLIGSLGCHRSSTLKPRPELSVCFVKSPVRRDPSSISTTGGYNQLSTMSSADVKSSRIFAVICFFLYSLTISVDSFSLGSLSTSKLINSSKLSNGYGYSHFELRALKEGASEKIAELRLQQSQLGENLHFLLSRISHKLGSAMTHLTAHQ